MTSAEVNNIRSMVPQAHWQTVDAVFTAANTDTIISHTLANVQVAFDPKKVRYEVIDSSAGGVVFRGVKAPQSNYIVLQATVIGTYRLRLFLETNLKV